ncbi:MAG: hypothetical protein JXR96_01365 [Deltaproteobacteria bacterium]|nr:hypothetical protein [Deltaproteobacteria bacterium]
MDVKIYHVCYGSWRALQRDCAQQLAMGGLLLATDATGATQFEKVELRVQLPDGEEQSLQAEVVQVLPGKGLAVQFAPDAAEALQAISAACESHAEQEGGAIEGPDPEVYPPGSAPPSRDGDAQSLPAAIEQMSVAEKRRAALRGRKAMRTLLIRDRNKTIHPFVIKNPGITLDEVEQIAKMPGVNPEVLRLIARNKDWVRSTTVARNLVRNPKTPLPEALALLLKLPMSEVRALAKSSNVRAQIQQAARRKVNA